jgi:uncharacterized membrane protein
MTAHLPVVGVPFAAGLMIAGLVGRSEVLWRAGCWGLLLAAGLAAFPYFSGPPAYELVAERHGVAEEPVERHAVVARGVSLGLVVLACVTVGALLRDRAGDPPGWWLRGVILAGAVAIAYGFAWSAHLGGLVRHPELAEPPLRVFPALPTNK